jgi:hypothetical protein
LYREGHVPGALLVDKLDAVSYGLKVILVRFKFILVMGSNIDQTETVICG